MKSKASSFLKNPCNSRLQEQGVTLQSRDPAMKKNLNLTRGSVSPRRVSNTNSVSGNVTDSMDL